MNPLPADSDICPRCGSGFHCGMQGSGPCPCTGVALSAAVLASLRQRYSGCLCLRCLQALADDQTLRTTTLPTE